MTTLLVRGLDESVKERIAAMARRKGISMEAEAREILSRSVSGPNLGLAFYELGQEAGGIDHLELPDRSEPDRTPDFE